jgi:catechol 2,3-dioxygenase-like lactoylglutathione lyase family enzyme
VTLAYGKLDEMREHVAPILNVSDAAAAVDWYRQLGFVKEWEHRFEAGCRSTSGLFAARYGCIYPSTAATPSEKPRLSVRRRRRRGGRRGRRDGDR